MGRYNRLQKDLELDLLLQEMESMTKTTEREVIRMNAAWDHMKPLNNCQMTVTKPSNSDSTVD